MVRLHTQDSYNSHEGEWRFSWLDEAEFCCEDLEGIILTHGE